MASLLHANAFYGLPLPVELGVPYQQSHNHRQSWWFPKSMKENPRHFPVMRNIRGKEKTIS